jgi:hypothetical protein
MASPGMPGAPGTFDVSTLSPETLAWYSQFWKDTQTSEESRFGRNLGVEQSRVGVQQSQVDASRAAAAATNKLGYAQLEESRQDRQMRLQVAMGQLEAEKERNSISRGAMEADAEYKRGVNALRQQELGASLLKTATDLFGTPESWTQAFNYARGVQGNQALAEPLRALFGGFQMPAFQAQTQTPDALTLGGLADRMTNGSGQAQAEYDANTSMGQWLGMNPQKIAPGGLEQLSDDERGYLAGALKASSVSPSNWLSAYARSRPGQGLTDTGLA